MAVVICAARDAACNMALCQLYYFLSEENKIIELKLNLLVMMDLYYLSINVSP